MNTQQFIAEFHHIASSLGGINQLRQLVMALALAGNLLGRNESLPEDFIKKMETARREYLEELGKRARALMYSEPLLEEFPIPDGWKWVRVGEVCDLQTGSTPSTRHPEYYGGDIRWLVSGDVNRGEILDCEGRITTQGLESSNCKILPIGSVLIALNGQGKTRGMVALLSIPAACNQSIVAMIPFSPKILNPDYLFISLKYRYYEIREITGQKQRRGLNMGLVSELSIPLPPIEEQDRVVGKVKELMAICKTLEVKESEKETLAVNTWTTVLAGLAKENGPAVIKSGWNRVHNNISLLHSKGGTVAFKRTIIDLGIRGLLTRPTVFSDNIEREARKRIVDLVERKLLKKRSWIADQHVNNKFYLPTEFEKAYLGNVAELITDGEHATPARIPHGPVPLVTAKNVRDGFFDLRDTDFVGEDTAIKAWTRCKPKHNDILMVCVGATTGRLLVAKEPVDMVLVRSVALIRMFNDLFMPEFVAYCLSGNWGQNQIWGNVKQAAQPCLYLSRIAKIQITAPPYEEQKRIVATLDRLLSTCNQLQDLSDTAARTATLFSTAAISSITGIHIKERERMKAPKTELVSNLKVGVSPTNNEQAPLAAILVRQVGELSAKVLWSSSGLEIEAFYKQLKYEMAQGWIVQPEVAYVSEV